MTNKKFNPARLKPGDKVYWTNPYGDFASRTITIKTVEHRGELIWINRNTSDGIEVRAKDLSAPPNLASKKKAPAQRQRAMNEYVFDRKYDPIPMGKKDQSVLTRNFDELDPKYCDAHHVWSAVDGDNGKSYLIPGYHVVNVYGYVQTRNPWTDEDADAGLSACYF